MPNAILKKDDDLTLVLPGDSVTGIMPVVDDPKHPNAKCVIYASLRGLTIYFLGITAREAFEKIQAAATVEKDWLELETVNGDACYIEPKSLLAAEEMKLNETELLIRIWVRRLDGEDIFAPVAHTPELMERLNGIIGGAEPTMPKSPVRRPRRN